MSNIPAIIPAAGRGTRLRPITRYLSKPMLPVGSNPVIAFAIEEALEAGCDPVIVVRSPGDGALRRYLEDEFQGSIRTCIQEEPLGLAHAALQGYRTFTGDSRCALLLPDNVVLDGTGIKPLLGVGHPDQLVLGTTEVPRERAPYFGNSGRYIAEPCENNPNCEVVTGLQEKGSGSFTNAADNWPARRAVARTLVPPAFFERTAEQSPDPSSGEIDDVPVYRAMIESSTALGVPIDGDVYDMGTPERYLYLNSTVHKRTVGRQPEAIRSD
ncbi:MAG: sugar phosphate nucleotidyltransferase [bacterium]